MHNGNYMKLFTSSISRFTQLHPGIHHHTQGWYGWKFKAAGQMGCPNGGKQHKNTQLTQFDVSYSLSLHRHPEGPGSYSFSCPWLDVCLNYQFRGMGLPPATCFQHLGKVLRSLESPLVDMIEPPQNQTDQTRRMRGKQWQTWPTHREWKKHEETSTQSPAESPPRWQQKHGKRQSPRDLRIFGWFHCYVYIKGIQLQLNHTIQHTTPKLRKKMAKNNQKHLCDCWHGLLSYKVSTSSTMDASSKASDQIYFVTGISSSEVIFIWGAKPLVRYDTS